MMKKKSLFILPALMLALAACATPSALAASSPQQDDTTPAETTRTLSVAGTGSVSLTPDIAYVYIGVNTEDKDAGRAVSKNNDQIEAVIAALKKAGVSEDDIRTTNFSIWAYDDYDFNGERTGTIFNVDNNIYVTVRDLDALGDLLAIVVDAGATNINGISFDVEDRSAAIEEAREQAVFNAKAEADALATVAGVKLGPILFIGSGNSGGVPAPYAKEYAGAEYALDAAVSSVPLIPGDLTVSVSVSIIFEIE